MIGITNGAFIALIALGYTLVYGIIELINFAHGDLFMLGTFVCLSTLTLLGFSTEVGTTGTPWFALLLAMLAAMIFCGLLNVLAERIAYRPLRRAPRLATLIRFTFKDLFVLALAIPLMLGLAWVIRSTRMGKAMRAVAQDSEMAQQMGIDVNRVIAFTFLLGGVLAGAASLMYGLYNNNTVFTLGFTAGLKAFTAAVLGGIGNVNGAALGGFVLGLLSALTVTYAGGQWENVGVFSLLVIILVFKPTGLLGQETGEKA